jgi:neutral ceramidase
VKWVFGGRLQHRIEPVATFPRVLPIQVVVIGPMAVLGLPFEVTVEAGRRLEHALLDSFGPSSPVRRAVVSSAANDYWDYLTTPEEYRRQAYEGASNLYGPQTLGFVTAAATELARSVADSTTVSDPVPERVFRFQLHRYLPAPTLSTAVRAGEGEPVFVEATASEDAYWEMRWEDRSPGDLSWHEPMVRLEVAGGGDWAPLVDSDGMAVDDGGWRVGVVHLGPVSEPGRGPAAGRHLYAARWYGPPLGRPGRYRFHLLASGRSPDLAGPAFD